MCPCDNLFSLGMFSKVCLPNNACCCQFIKCNRYYCEINIKRFMRTPGEHKSVAIDLIALIHTHIPLLWCCTPRINVYPFALENLINFTFINNKMEMNHSHTNILQIYYAYSAYVLRTHRCSININCAQPSVATVYPWKSHVRKYLQLHTFNFSPKP